MISKPLASVTKIVAGQSPESSTYNSTGEGLPFFQGKADFQDMHPTVRIWCTSKKRKEAEPGDILISVRAPVGAVNICNQKSIIGRGLAAIRPSSELDGKFLYYWLKANERQIDALGTGSTFKAITQDTLKKIEVPVPPFDDQIRIAHLLGKVEELIVQRKQHLQQLDDLLNSLFLELFGECLKEEDSYQPILEACDFIDYRGKTPPRVGTGIPLISAKCVRRGYFDATRLDFVSDETYRNSMTRGFPKANDVLFTTEGATFGYTCRIPRDFQKFAVGQRIITLVCKNGFQPEVLEFVLNAPHIQKKLNSRLSGSAALGIRSAELAKVVIPFPTPEAQIQFSSVVEKVEGIKSRYQQSLTDLESLYGALSQQAFKGELDLSHVALPAVPSEGESSVATVLSAPITTPVINLPGTDLLLPALQDRAQLAPLLRFWLETYRTQLGGVAFSLERFIADAQTRLDEQHPDNDFEWTASDYDSIKAWVFEALAAGSLTQAYDDEGNCIELKAVAEQGLV